jgi:hypothetical protein
MRWLARALGLIALVACGSLVGGAPLKGRVFAFQEVVPASGNKDYVYPFKARERASVTVSGSGATYLGLYVFDQFGNCVASDVGTSRNTCDDLAVEWYPPEGERYAIEVKNLGPLANAYELSVR